MRGVNLIAKRRIQLGEWARCLEGSFPRVWLEHSQGLAQREGHPQGWPNELGVENGDDHVVILDRPTTIREYEEDEIDALRNLVDTPEQFLAVDYTDEALVRRVLGRLLLHEGRQTLFIEDENGEFAALEDFLGTP